MSDPVAPVNVAVIGAGALGKEHARVYASLAAASRNVRLAGVFDISQATARSVAQHHRTTAFASIEETINSADAVSIVTPTGTHYDIAKQFLLRGKHVLVEKPMTNTVAQAEELVQIAAKNNGVLQVGHVERFNPVFRYLEEVAREPRFIEAHRLSQYSGRSTDVGVVLDLMIHDLDVILAFVASRVVSVDAVGVSVLSETEDIANARLRFENRCVANITVSRVSPERMRKIRVFSGGPSPSYISLDYRAQEGFIYRIAPSDAAESSLFKKLLRGKDTAIVSEFAGKRVVREPVPIVKDEPLKLELQHFIDCVREQQTPLVSGESGKRALDLALEITRQIQANRP
jgi:predicted dehydrogenase